MHWGRGTEGVCDSHIRHCNANELAERHKKLRTARYPPSPLPDQTVSPGRTYIDSTLNTSTCGRIRFPTWSPTSKLPFTDFWEMQIGVYDLAGIFRISRRRRCRMIFESFQMSQWPLLSISIRLRAGCPQFPEIRETPLKKDRFAFKLVHIFPICK